MYLSTGTDKPAIGPFPVARPRLRRSRGVPERDVQGRPGDGRQRLLHGGPSRQRARRQDQRADADQDRRRLPGGGDRHHADAIATRRVGARREGACDRRRPRWTSVDGDASSDLHPRSARRHARRSASTGRAQGEEADRAVFATPKLCASRVCGPIVDVAEEVQPRSRRRRDLHPQEIYKDNDINKGYRPQVAAYGLTSEPFTFVIGADGKVVEQLQGPFVADELRAAIKKAQSSSQATSAEGQSLRASSRPSRGRTNRNHRQQPRSGC